MEWNDEDTFKLISLYEENEFLWNAKHDNYRNRLEKNAKMLEFAIIFGCTCQEIQRKIHNLRNQVSHEIHKIKKKNCGGENDAVYRGKWKFFNALKFISNVFTSSATNSNLVKTEKNTKETNDDQQGEVAAKNISEGNECQNQKKRKLANDNDDNIRETIQVIKKPKDDFDRFGEYIALEIRSMKSDFYKGRLKSEIRKAVARLSEEDERWYWSFTTTNSNSVASPSDSSCGFLLQDQMIGEF